MADLPAVPAADELASTLELCEKREAHVTRLVAREVEAARAHAAANNRKAALEAMKRKKLHDKELERLSAQKLSLMQQEQTLHALKFNNVVITTQQNGAAAIEREVKKVKGAEGVDKVLDRLEEALDEAGDVLGASSRVMGEAAGLDDDELLEELEQMELAEELYGIADVSDAAEPTRMPTPGVVPAPVPRTTAAQIAKQRAEEHEERELAELVALQAAMKVEDAMPMPMAAMKVEHSLPQPLAVARLNAMAIEPPMAMHMPMMAACF